MTLRLKLIALGLLGIAAVSGYIAWDQHERKAGAVAVERRDAALVIEAKQREIEQIQRDAKASEDAVNGYKAELDRLQADIASRGVAPIRLCVSPPGSGRGVRPTPEAAGNLGPATPAGRDGAEVPTGAVAGPDIGPTLRIVALVADELGAQVRALLIREHALNE